MRGARQNLRFLANNSLYLSNGARDQNTNLQGKTQNCAPYVGHCNTNRTIGLKSKIQLEFVTWLQTNILLILVFTINRDIARTQNFSLTLNTIIALGRYFFAFSVQLLHRRLYIFFSQGSIIMYPHRSNNVRLGDWEFDVLKMQHAMLFRKCS